MTTTPPAPSPTPTPTPEAPTPEAPTPEASTPRRLRPTPRGRARLRGTARGLAVPLLLAALVTAGSPGWGLYTIRQGDTLSEIAERYGTSVDRLVQVNRLPGNGNLILAGTTLRVPGRGSAGGSQVATRSHRVVRGDTLSGIAERYRVSQESLRKANGIGASNIVMLGTTLRIPGDRAAGTGTGTGTGTTSGSSSNTFAGRTYSRAVVGAAAHNRALLARRHLPSREAMRAIIAAKARTNGVDPALALAVSYQESGWNQRVVSVANAVGAMQVIPTTTDWISGVVGRRLNPLDPQDNATTGVVLLRILTHAADNERQAVAAYYQGLRSVRENGMFPDTRRYVANVMALKRQFG